MDQLKSPSYAAHSLLLLFLRLTCITVGMKRMIGILRIGNGRFTIDFWLGCWLLEFWLKLLHLHSNTGVNGPHIRFQKNDTTPEESCTKQEDVCVCVCVVEQFCKQHLYWVVIYGCLYKTRWISDLFCASNLFVWQTTAWNIFSFQPLTKFKPHLVWQ